MAEEPKEIFIQLKSIPLPEEEGDEDDESDKEE